MIVDDDELMIEFCKEAIEEHGYRSFHFSDSIEALTWFKENKEKVSVALVDVVIPQMNGIDMVKYCRKIKDDLNVIWISAYLSPDMERPKETDPVLKK